MKQQPQIFEKVQLQKMLIPSYVKRTGTERKSYNAKRGKQNNSLNKSYNLTNLEEIDEINTLVP